MHSHKHTLLKSSWNIDHLRLALDYTAKIRQCQAKIAFRAYFRLVGAISGTSLLTILRKWTGLNAGLSLARA